MKRKIFTLLLSACLGSMAMAQDAPTGVVKKASVAPVVDGYVDEVWAGANIYNIVLPYTGEIPTLGDPGETTWRALWTSEGIYVLVQVTDDVFMPAFMGDVPGNSYQYDKPEVYFDCNSEKKDGLGPQTDGMGLGNGHYQFAPPFIEANIGGGVIGPGDQSHGAPYATHVVGSNYVYEYFVPFTILLDGTGAGVDQTAPIGFDVTVIDNDDKPNVRRRAVWSNIGAITESWNNMDDCGTVTLSDEEAIGGGIVNKATVAPEIDGKVDEVWATANSYNINKPFYRNNTDPGFPAFEVPTLGESTWKALWNAEGMFILLEVDDDNWYPSWVAPLEPGKTTNDSYMYDKPELYFDMNVPRVDGVGGHDDTKGSIQIAPESKEGILDGSIQTFLSKPTGVDVNFAYLVTEPKYVVEYFVPWDALVDKDGKAFDKMTSMGFDVTLIDQDDGVTTTRNRAVWMNTGTGTGGNESWGNMDAAGVLTFASAAEVVDVESITVTGGSITTDNGTLQMIATVEPSDATTQSVSWFVENGTGRATISSKGVLSATVNGTVMVKAVSKDGTDIEAKATVTISGQKVTKSDISVIKNGNFEFGPDFKLDWGGPGTVTDGWYTVECTLKNEIWDTMFGQIVPVADASTAYTVSFKAVASADMTIPMVIEDRGNQNNKTVTSTSLYRSTENWQIPITTKEEWYTVDVIFSDWMENSRYELNFQVGKNEGLFSVDSIQMYSDADLALIKVGVKTLSNVNNVKLYPNPVQNELTVSKIATANSKVSVYNAVGQKLMEKTANGTQAKFDVSNLRKGMYFVRFSDGTSQKFIKQ